MHRHFWFCFTLLLVFSTTQPLAAQNAESESPAADQVGESPEQAGESAAQETDAQQASTGSQGADGADDAKDADAAADEEKPPQAAQQEKQAAEGSEPGTGDEPKDDGTGEKRPAEQEEDGRKDAEKDGSDKSGDGRQEKPPMEEAEQNEKPQEPEIPRLPTLGYTDTPRLPGQPWRVHDLLRPRPRSVEPGEFGEPAGPPSDAIVLFDGSDLSQWCHRKVSENGDVELFAPQWTLGDGFFEVKPQSGSLQTLDTFGSCQLHVEWATPSDVEGDSQQRGNSGIKLMGMFEIQVLDSYNNRTYADGVAGAIYGQYPPEVTAARAPGEWQTYDIIFEAPLFRDGELEKPAYVTVLHNGVLLHHRRELLGVTKNKLLPEYEPVPPAGPLELQDHKDPVRYRNIWIRRLD